MDILQTLLPGLTAFAGAWLAHRFGLRQAEHGTRFQRQYERRDEVIGKTWQLLLEADNRFHNWSSPIGYEGEPSKLEQAKPVHEAMREFVRYYRSHMLWFDQYTLDKLNRFTDDFWSHFYDLYDGFESTNRTEELDAWQKASRWTREGLQEWVRDIESEFRRALGVEARPWWRRTWRFRRDNNRLGG